MPRLLLQSVALAAVLLVTVGQGLAQTASVAMGPVDVSAPRGSVFSLSLAVGGPQAAAINSFAWRLEVPEALFEPLCGGVPCANLGVVDCTVTGDIPAPDPASPVDFVIPSAPGVPFVRVRYAAYLLGATLGHGGVVFTCQFRVKATAPMGTQALACATSPPPFASDSVGAPIEPATCVDGTLEVLPVSVVPTPTPGGAHLCPGDCNGDGAVTVVELIVGVNIALGTLEVSRCPSFDVNDDGAVTVNELIMGVNADLFGCSAVAPGSILPSSSAVVPAVR